MNNLEYYDSPEIRARLKAEHEEWVRTRNVHNIPNYLIRNSNGRANTLEAVCAPTTEVERKESEIVYKYALSFVGDKVGREAVDAFDIVAKAYKAYVLEGHLPNANFDVKALDKYFEDI